MIDYTFTIGEEEREVLVDLTTQDESYIKRQRLLQAFGVLVSIGIFAIGILSHSIVFEIGGVAFLLLDIFAVAPIQKKGLQDAYKKLDQRMISGERHYIIDKDGIKISSAVGDGRTRWDGFIANGEHGHYIWLQRADRQMLLLDKKILSEDELVELKGYMNQI